MVNLSSEYRRRLPTAQELPCSDETPVDNELQNDIPNILLHLLIDIWGDRSDWFFGVDMAVYYDPDLENPKKSKSVVPDGFLALGVKKRTDEGGRLSYAIWQEGAIPIFFLEVVSKKYNNEYETKLTQYAEIGVLYYVVYNPLSGKGIHKNRQSLEVYKLIEGKYELQSSVARLPEGVEMVWMPEIDLGIGCERADRGDWQREWVYWYDRHGKRYPTARERALQEQQARIKAEMLADRSILAKQEAEAIAEQERQKNEKLEAYLRSLGINPNEV
ncbi:Uma2 family endonuclease [Pseudanabaena sp. PCC 6802]|uniref:Uma2 family endonuclease n=1 Tax=Pseudanabaena sp. PCC 6802 TaxID=118173 RepID=UPI00037C98D3|nr:Uma2 family endonuclease [Pseudanabaena sp. PCC 6802]